MKKSRIIVALLILAVLVVGICVIVVKCSNNSSDDNGGNSSNAGKEVATSGSIVGKWKDENDEVYLFNVDGTYKNFYEDDGTILEKGEYEINGNELLTVDENEDETKYTFKIEEDKLSLTYTSKRRPGIVETYVYTRVK